MSKALKFEVSGGYPGGFVADVDGYKSFVTPIANGSSISWSWTIQSGGGWGGSRGDGPIVEHSTGSAISSQHAEEDILEALEALGASPEH